MRRRTFLCGSTLLIAGNQAFSEQASPSSLDSALSIGLLTDVHYADKKPNGSRHYRESLRKIEEASDLFNRKKIDFAVEMGDLIDAADSVETEKRYLKTINRKFESLCSERHYVLGNHCVDTLTKEEFLGDVGQNRSYYSFDQAGFHFVILDSCFTADETPYGRKNFKWTDANLPIAELEWLRADLSTHTLPTIIFAHQRIDTKSSHGVRNGEEIRKILESSKNVKAVFQGHSHGNDLKWINGIPYCTCVAMVEGSGIESNGYSLLELYPDSTLKLHGFRKQASESFDTPQQKVNG